MEDEEEDIHQNGIFVIKQRQSTTGLFGWDSQLVSSLTDEFTGITLGVARTLHSCTQSVGGTEETTILFRLDRKSTRLNSSH